jgi:hypothetical protein
MTSLGHAASACQPPSVSKLLRQQVEEKSRDGAKLRLKHDKPLTPFQRLLASPDVSAAMKERMKKANSA